MKPLCFLGDSLKRLRAFPVDERNDAEYQLHKVQQGALPDDFKPMPAIGAGVEEIRVWESAGTYRVTYTARMANALYVLHAFQKTTQATSKADIALARSRYAELQRGNP